MKGGQDLSLIHISIRAVKLIVSKMADAVIEAKQGTADADGEIEAESEEFAATEE